MRVPGAGLALLAGLALVLAAPPAGAETQAKTPAKTPPKTRALLVGVSEYPNFPAERQLRAPANDVRRMQAALEARGLGAGDMVVLADGVEGAAGAPTRAAILAGLERLAQEVDKGDLVIFYASGHGSRQPSRTALKVDGLDQVFLPRDAAPPKPGAPRNRFETVIAGPDFGERLDAIRARGADVWFILDSCFSGSASRAVGEGVHDKKIELEDIGLTASTLLAPQKTMVLRDLGSTLPPGSGWLAAFYASQPNETAREVALPPTAPLDKRVWGSIFTTAFTEVLQRSPALSYRQLMVETGRVLRADAAFQARQTPSFEGDGLDESPPGAGEPGAGALWRVSGGMLHAGQLAGVEAGAVVALYAGVSQPADEPSGFGRVEKADGLNATLAAIAPECVAKAASCVPLEGSAVLLEATYARLARPAPPASFGISRPRPWPGSAGPDAAAQERARTALEAALAGPLKERVRFDDAAPALVAWMTADGFRFMPDGLDPNMVEAGPQAVIAPGAAPDQVAGGIARALLRARQLTQLQALASAGGSGDLSVSVAVRRFGFDAASGHCAFKGEAVPIDPQGPGESDGAAGLVQKCDKVQVAVENRSRRPVLAAIFFLDDGWNLIARRPTCPVGLSVSDRLEPGRRLLFDVPYHPRSIVPGLAPTTTNGVFVIGVPFVEGESDLPALCALTGFNDKAGPPTRGEELGGLDELMDGVTRGGRLALESASLSLAFWPIGQPVRP